MYFSLTVNCQLFNKIFKNGFPKNSIFCRGVHKNINDRFQN